ncbi:MAG: IS3 family transposase [Serratia symbiotica]|nr:IS3 family transposase [Serratia symbiotica]
MKQAIAEYLNDYNNERISRKAKVLGLLSYQTQTLKAA